MDPDLVSSSGSNAVPWHWGHEWSVLHTQLEDKQKLRMMWGFVCVCYYAFPHVTFSLSLWLSALESVLNWNYTYLPNNVLPKQKHAGQLIIQTNLEFCIFWRKHERCLSIQKVQYSKILSLLGHLVHTQCRQIKTSTQKQTQNTLSFSKSRFSLAGGKVCLCIMHVQIKLPENISSISDSL